MDTPGEIEALKAEQRRLQAALDRLDERIQWFERQSEPPAARPAVTPPLPAPPPISTKPVVSLEPEPLPQPPLIAEERPLPQPPVREPAPPPLPERQESLEIRLGRVWLVRIGIVILLTGLVFLGNYAYHELIGRIGAGGKLALLYLAGAGLCTLGRWLARRQASLVNYGRVLIAGGCATVYYATYAAHFIPALRVIESPLLGGTLLLGLGGAFVAWSDRLRSQPLAAATIALSFYTAAINPADNFSLFSNLVISAAAVVLLARRRWVSVTFLSLVGTYGSFAFWRFQQTGTLTPSAINESVFWAAVLFPAAYWIVHTAAGLLHRLNALDPEVRPGFLTLNNAAFFALAGPAIAGTYPSSFWLAAVIFGVVLLGLSAIAARTAPEEMFFDGAYLTQGLALVFLGLIYHFTGWQLALSFSLASATMVSLGRLRHGGVYRFFAGACALVAIYIAFRDIVQGSEHARLVAYSVASILAATAWLLKRNLGLSEKVDWRSMGFTVLAGILVVPACLEESLPWSGARMLAIALIATLLLKLHRLREFAYIAQLLAVYGQVVLLAHTVFQSGTDLPVALSTAFALAFVHFWQWQKDPGLIGRKIWQPIHCIVPVTLALAWSFQKFSSTERGPELAGLAILLLAYAALTRTWVIAASSIPFTFAAYAVTAGTIFERSNWLSPAATIGLLTAQSFAITALLKKAPISPKLPAHAALSIRGLTLLAGVGMVFAYLPDQTWFLTLSTIAFLFFLIASAARSGEALIYAWVTGTVAAASWIGRLPTAPAQWMDIFGFAMALVAQQMGKRRLKDTSWFGPQAQALLAGVIVLGTWILIHRLVETVAGGFLVTVSWSLLALVVLGGGFALRERAYRLLGLAVLAAAIGRIFFIDVWQLEPLFRILSFLVLGAVLLALGFLYNRFAEALRRWL